MKIKSFIKNVLIMGVKYCSTTLISILSALTIDGSSSINWNVILLQIGISFLVGAGYYIAENIEKLKDRDDYENEDN